MYLCIDAISNQQKDNNNNDNELKKTKKHTLSYREGDINRLCSTVNTLQTQSHEYLIGKRNKQMSNPNTEHCEYEMCECV